MPLKPPSHPVDLHVGARLRLKRQIAGMSQIDLAAAIGVTFQQVQKYEVGTNRISASSLHAAATALKAPIGWFFQDFEAGDAATAIALTATREGWELARLMAHMPPRRRRQVLALIGAVVDADLPAIAA